MNDEGRAETTVDLTPKPPIEIYDEVRRVLGTDYLSRPAQRAIETTWPAAYRAGREDAARDARPMLNAVYGALHHARQICRFHGDKFDASGFQFGLPRCESCRQPWRIAQALELVVQARDGGDQSGPASPRDRGDNPEERR